MFHPQSQVFLSVSASSDSARYPPEPTTDPVPVVVAVVVAAAAGSYAVGADDRQLCPPYVDGAV